MDVGRNEAEESGKVERAIHVEPHSHRHDERQSVATGRSVGRERQVSSRYRLGVRTAAEGFVGLFAFCNLFFDRESDFMRKDRPAVIISLNVLR